MRDVDNDYDNTSIVLRSLTDPKCTSVNILKDKINYQVDLELGIELVGDIKLKVAVDDSLDDYPEIVAESNIDKEIENSVNTDYIKE